jgi:hypothetical protein
MEIDHDRERRDARSLLRTARETESARCEAVMAYLEDVRALERSNIYLCACVRQRPVVYVGGTGWASVLLRRGLG